MIQGELKFIHLTFSMSCHSRVNKSSVLVHKSRTHLEGMLEDPMLTVVFTLIYELGEPRVSGDRTVRDAGLPNDLPSGGAVAEWVRVLDWRPDGPGFESHC